MIDSPLLGVYVMCGALWFLLALRVGAAGRTRNRSFAFWFLVALVVSPLFAMILLVAFGGKESYGGMTKFDREDARRD